MTREAEIAWAAGLFEGEGCFTISNGKQKNGTTYSQARVKINMTDEDTMLRFNQIMGFGNFRVDDAQIKHGYKRQWEWYVSNKKDVLRAIELFWPWLGVRRKARATELLAIVKD